MTTQSEMDKLIQRYMNHLSDSVSDKTKDDYKSDLEVFKDYLESQGLKIKNVTLENLENYAEYLRTKPVKRGKETQIGYAPSTRSRMLQLVKYLFEYLNGIKYVAENPSVMLKLPKIPDRQPVYLDLYQAKLLLEVVDKERNEFLRLRDKAMLLTFLTHGLRVEEMANMKISDIKDDKLSVIGKGDKERVLILTSNVLKAIDEYLNIRFDVDTDYLFLSTRRKQIHKRTIQATVDKYLNNAGLMEYSTHKLRSTAATLMSDQGVQISDIQEILGHKDIATTKIYVDTSTVKKEQIAQKMNDLFAN